MSETTTSTLPNQISDIKWTPYLACAYAEGFCEGEAATLETSIEAWAYLIKTGQCWTLQGWYGRNASELIKAGIIENKTGKIDWDKINELRGG